MEKRSFFYTAEPITRDVPKEEFFEFVKNYPRKLERDVFGACDPPAVSYNDFELANRWPYSIVASTHLYSDDPGDFWYAPKDEQVYRIVINHEELFASKTGNKA